MDAHLGSERYVRVLDSVGCLVCDGFEGCACAGIESNCCAPAEFRGVCSHVGSEGCVSVLGCWVCACVVVYEAYEHLNLVPRGVFTCVGSWVCAHFRF